MGFFNDWGKFMMEGARAHATWELEVSRAILGDKRRMLILGLVTLPAIVGCIAFADQVGEAIPQFLGGKTAYSPAFYSTGIFVASILIGVIAGLITGCIGAGGGFVIAPAMMSAGIKGILAVGTDLFHIFAKAIMGSVIHRKLGNVSVPLAVVFLIGAMIGATVGGLINRVLYEINPVLSDAFITVIYAVMLGFLGFYALIDFLKASNLKKKKDFHGSGQGAHGGKDEGTEMGSLPQKIQGVKVPPMIKFDHDFTPGGRSISWIFLVLSGALVGLAAGIMGVGGGFLTFPIFVYVLGVSSMTTVGTDVFQIIFTAGFAAVTQYAIYGFIFYTLAMGMLLGSLLGIQIGAMVTKVVKGITIRGFYAMAVLAGFVNRVFALPSKLGSMEVLPISKETGTLLENIGIVAFFLAVGIFGIWVIGTFLKNIRVLKRGRIGLIENAKQFYTGLGLMIGFVVVLILFFMPFYSGKNALDYLDNLYNTISKGSAYYIPKASEEARKFKGTSVSVNLKMAEARQAEQTAALFRASGAEVTVSGAELKVTGDFERILLNALADSDAMYKNDGRKVSDKYGYDERRVLYNWWKAVEEMDKDLSRQKKFKEAKVAVLIQKKAIECSYNYYTIEPQNIGDRWGTVLFSLLFYVIYTLWYGFAILFMFEGWGLKLGH